MTKEEAETPTPHFQDATPPSPDTDARPLNTYVPLAHR
jgi:hypothetical protein